MLQINFSLLGEFKMGLLNLFKAQFKKPAFETVDEICNAYINEYQTRKDSKIAFQNMASEAFNQLRMQGKNNFSSIEETYRMLSGKNFNELGKNHSQNSEFLGYYVMNMMAYIRPDLYTYRAGDQLLTLQNNLRDRVKITLSIPD